MSNDRPITGRAPTGHLHLSHGRGALFLVLAVVVSVATLVGVALGSGAGSPATSGATSLSPAIESAATSVSAETLRVVGAQAGLTAPAKVPGQRPPLLGPDTKPEVLYVGAESCPFCAAERWALVVALSHFGRFTGLAATHSSSSDVYPDTPTFSFYRSTYAGSHIDFAAVELQANEPVGGHYPTLQRLTSSQQAVLDAYDTAPYTSVPRSIPFIDIGNRFVLVGAGFDPAVLQGKSMAQIAEALSQPSTAIARAVDGSASLLVAAITNATGIQPDR